MNTISQISNELRRAQREHGLTQQDLRDAAGLSRQTMSNVLKGTEDFKLSTLLAVADKLGLELALLPKVAMRALPQAISVPVVETMVDRIRAQLLGNNPAPASKPNLK